MAVAMVNTLLEQLEKLGQDIKHVVDDGLRRKLLHAAQQLALKLETPGDTIQRIIYLPLQLTAAKIAGDLDLFETMVKTDGSATVDVLAKQVHADPLLLGRLLRYLASVGMVRETAEDQYAATEITHTLIKPGLKAGVKHNFVTVMPCFQQLPKFLADTKYANPSDPTHSPFQPAHGTDLPPFVWILSHPDEFGCFIQWMTGQREGQKTWLDVFPVQEKLLAGATAETPVFVDVGGGAGHQCVAFRTKFPDAPGRVVLQDMPPVIAQSIPHDGFEKMATDFWTPQPIKGARAYYLRNIMHDYPDQKCVAILQNIISAMEKRSVILIDEMVMPNRGQHWKATQVDVTMMATLAAVERSEKQWYTLMDLAGLKIEKIYQYTDEVQDSIIVAVPK
ncbi:MAG: hypothetical protein M1826_000326 [Phylliscum demangeonii]|nr:MAG: hypothetical protein M1826_000326 [Phylliscum demangeonii]